MSRQPIFAFPKDETVPTAFSTTYDPQLGQRVIDGAGNVWRLCESKNAVTDPSRKLFHRDTEGDNWIVEITEAAADPVVGVAHQNLTTALAVGDYFWLQTFGNTEVEGDAAATSVTLGHYMGPSAAGGASDGRMVTTGALTHTPLSPLRATTAYTTPAAGTAITVRIDRELS